MSHAVGAVKFSNGEVFYCEYNGTVDVMKPELYKTRDELNANWRHKGWKSHSKECHNEEAVEIASSYGYGFSWSGAACKTCLVITDSYDPLDAINKLPEWFPDRESYNFKDKK